MEKKGIAMELELLRKPHNPSHKDSSIFKQKSAHKLLWIHSCFNPYWVQEALKRKGFQALSRSEKGCVSYIRKRLIHLKAKKTEDKTEENLFIFRESNVQNDDDESFGGPDSLIALLKSCAKKKDIHTGTLIHADIAKRGILKRDVLVGSTLVYMYAKCGKLAKAQGVFDELPVRDIVSWNILILGYVEHGYSEEALNVFQHMQQHDGLSPNAITFVCILKACGHLRAMEKGQDIHVMLMKDGLLKNNILVGNALVDMYVKCGSLGKAKEVFDELPFRDVVSWTMLIAGYTQHGHGEVALKCYECMKQEGVEPDEITFLYVLKACGSIGALYKGQEAHGEIISKGILNKDVFVGNALVDMYTKCGDLARAQHVFNNLKVKNVITWTTLITGYAGCGLCHKAIHCFQDMQRSGLQPDEVTLVCILKVCGKIGAIDRGQDIHAEIVREGLLRRSSISLGNALVEMYAKCNALEKAHQVFNEVSSRNLMTWNAIISGYVEHAYGEKAMHFYELMRNEGLIPNAMTFICILKACGIMGATSVGQQIHEEMINMRLLETDNLVVGTALIDMYVKCGLVAKAQEIFDELPIKDTVTWTMLLTGYAELGKHDIVFKSLDKMMREEGIHPDSRTFCIVLNTCCHSGLLHEGQLYFKAINKCYGVSPTIEHHSCMIDLFGRAGCFDEALGMMKEMPFHADLTLWHILLGASKKWGDENLGKFAFENAIQMNENDDVAYACMSYIYAGGYAKAGIEIL